MAVQTFIHTSQQTIAARATLTRVIESLGNTIPTMRKILRKLEYIRDHNPSKLGFDRDMIIRLIDRVDYFLEVGGEMFSVEKGIPYKKLFENHCIWEMGLVPQDLYDFLILSAMMKLMWFKSISPLNLKYTHILIIDDAISALRA